MTSAVAYAAICAVGLLGHIVDAPFVHIPLIGFAVAFFIGGTTSAYAALDAVRSTTC